MFTASCDVNNESGGTGKADITGVEISDDSQPVRASVLLDRPSVDFERKTEGTGGREAEDLR